MRLIVDLPDELVRRMRELEFRGRYGSAEEFIWAAVENQLLLEERGTMLPPAAAAESWGRLLARPSSPVATVPAEEASAGPLWGMVNRFLPVKVGARVLANLLAHEGAEWVVLEELEAKAGAIAREFGLFLHDLDLKVGRRAEQRLSTGLPTGEQAEKSVSRYQEHFLASTPESALRKLGFAATAKNLIGERVVGITKAGADFAGLTSPPLDEGDYTICLSKQEAEFLIEQVKDSVKEEWGLWAELSGLLGKEGLAQEQLRLALAESRGWQGGTLTTMMTGVLARMRELGLVRSRGRGPGAIHAATGAGPFTS